MGTISRCAFRSPCGKLVRVVHGDDILLGGPTLFVDAVRESLRQRYETREQMLEGRPTDASEIMMLNRRVPNYAGTPMPVSRSGVTDSKAHCIGTGSQDEVLGSVSP